MLRLIRCSPLAALLLLWARVLLAAISVGAIGSVAHARTLATAAAPENSPLGLARNPGTAHVGAERSQAPESPLQRAFGYGQLASDSAYATRGSIPRITEKGINRVEAHLNRLGAATEPPNAAMIQRLRSGQATPHDKAFYMHELKESAVMNRGVGARDAHLQTLEWQGIPYRPGYESRLYHPDVIRAHPEYFNPAAHP